MMFQILIITSLVALAAGSSSCPPAFSNKCICGRQDYSGDHYVVNCSYTGFTDASMLQRLPPETEVLIFRGNNVSELPVNIFGIHNNTKLKIVDMTGNHIKLIRGKTFHHVSNVQRLILNHNDISISSDNPTEHHPRLFSNFENLEELHLTDAFADNTPEDLAADLHDIFVSSELKKLKKLHLEQNEIFQFDDEQVFCDLPSLEDLHIGQNNLHGVSFNITCMKNLRFIDLESNSIYTLTPKERARLDEAVTSRQHDLEIDLSNNPLSCNCEDIYNWLNSTKVDVRNKNKLHCVQSNQYKLPECNAKLIKMQPLIIDSNSYFLTSLLFLSLCASLALNIYSHRSRIEQTLVPAFHSVTKKVHYTSITKSELPEMDV
ncbi:leucine-rich repeat transmembrane neuronal protein 2 [Nilaparvata lugens]|uniref:leucine-rich repeat transmembrane neuronal protein 2 n=1 Tax=Nilaparvata lugens TaxID=108931 RepID=UPI00193EAE3E|nr:leucine-rich repeat transmembrane neuronal protein 2 [Nilaparvata lugens]